MGIDIKIRVDLSPMQKRFARGALLAGVVIAVLGVSVALATVPNTFSSGGSLSSQQMNQNFTYLDDKLTAATVITTDAGSYSVGATTYCGQSAVAQTGAFTYSGGLTGYAAAKAACAAASGCGPTAHMCSGEELSRSAQLGIQPPVNTLLWFSMMSVGALNPVTRMQLDCSGWTYNTDSSQYGGAFGVSSSGQPQPNANACNAPIAIACCK